jgi:DHA1 family bicyclomycin/chloramphenicol resistance-like MFS transporter
LLTRTEPGVATETATPVGPSAPRLATSGLVATLVCLCSLNQLAISIFLPAMPAMASALGADGVAAKATLSVYLLVYAASLLVHGPLSDRFGRRPVVVGGLALYTVASFACALAPTIEVLLAARALQAFGAASGNVMSRAIARDAMDGASLARVNAYISTGQGLSPALAPFLGGLLTEWGDWTWTFHVTGLVGVGLLAVTVPWLGETNRHRVAAIDARSVLEAFGSVLRNRAFLGVAATASFATAPWYGYFAGSPELIIGRFGISPAVYGGHLLVLLGLFMLGGVLCALTAGRWSERTLLVAGFAVTAAGIVAFIALAVSGHLTFPAILAAMGIYAAGQSVLFPTAATAVIRPFREKAGTAASAYSALFMAIAAVGSLAPALVSDDVIVGLSAMMAVSMTMAVAVFVSVVLRLPRQ